jgi:hypothetical protein
MATFNPFGFQWAYSTSAASQASPTLVEFPWNPSFSGWTGDLAIQYLPGDTANSILSTDGFAYPGYVATNIGFSTHSLNYPPIIGVIAGFRYTPVSNSILTTDSWPSYEIGTAVLNNKVTVIVNTDIQGRYAIQFKGYPALKGLTQNFLFGQAFLGTDFPYVQKVGGFTFTFPIGNSAGLSSLYITEVQTQKANVVGSALARTTTYPVFLQTPARVNDWYDPAAPNASENENTIMTVLLNNNFITTNWEPTLYQVPVTT